MKNSGNQDKGNAGVFLIFFGERKQIIKHGQNSHLTEIILISKTTQASFSAINFLKPRILPPITIYFYFFVSLLRILNIRRLLSCLLPGKPAAWGSWIL